MSPWSALPPHIDEPNEWNGKDDDQHWFTKWRKSVKGWFAFGPRATEWWARWREHPITIFALFGEGDSRWENTDGSITIRSVASAVFWYAPSGQLKVYLSRIQYWCDWHTQLQWPLFFGFHAGNWQGYIGFKRDADKVYWLALYFGRKNK